MRLRCRRFGVLALWAAQALSAQSADPGKELNQYLSEQTGDRLKVSLEFRTRLEERTGNNFGRSADLDNPLFRTRVGLQYDVTNWWRVSAMAQDSRAPEYGEPAPATARNTIDLQEGYLEFFARRQTGFGALLGRQMVSLGEGRVIGIPQWVNSSRTYDTARLYYRLPRMRLEVLSLSIVRVRPDEFDRPNLGDRLWGTYDTFSNVIPKGTLEVYLLRHDQNRPGGFTGIGRLAINSFGGRAVGKLPLSLKYGVEAIVQNGKTGTLRHRAYAWYAGLSRQVRIGLPLDLEVEYKYASGSRDPVSRDNTYDQLYAANHDKFGHADLFGWRNIRNLRSLDTLHLSKVIALNFMYNNWWLDSASDGLYGGSGALLVRSPKGNASRHIGQEADVFATFQVAGWTFGAGFAHVFAGEYLKRTTPGADTRYLYVFQSYSF